MHTLLMLALLIHVRHYLCNIIGSLDQGYLNVLSGLGVATEYTKQCDCMYESAYQALEVKSPVKDHVNP